jgi:Fungal specific transcription factor domain
MMEDSLVTLQCLVLAQLSCLLSADYSRLLRYKGFAIGLSQRLGLHQSQKQYSFGALTSETRKKVFWTLYTLDW